MRGARPLLLSVLIGGAALSPAAKGCDAYAEPRVPDGPVQAQAAPGAAVGAKLAELPLPAGHYDPRSVRLPEGAPERAVRAALELGDRLGAQQLASEALLKASDADSRGRLMWLSAQVNDEPL